MSESTFSVPLGFSVSEGLVLDQVEWWEEDSRFALVTYLVEGVKQEFGIRVDLDKRIFLDRLDRADEADLLEDCLPFILHAVADYRSLSARRQWRVPEPEPEDASQAASDHNRAAVAA